MERIKYPIDDSENVVVGFDRESVCHGDDINDNSAALPLPKSMLVHDLLSLLSSNYVPIQSSITWVILSNIGVLGYIIRDNEDNLYIEDHSKTISAKSIGEHGITEVYGTHRYDGEIRSFNSSSFKKLMDKIKRESEILPMYNL